jgi:hypothetical protein
VSFAPCCGPILDGGERRLKLSRPSWILALVAVLVGAFAFLPAGALGARPEIFHVNFLDTEEDADLCGITVDIVATGTFTDKAFFDGQGNLVRFQSTSSARITFTAENGKSVINQFANQYVEAEPIIDEAAGTITFVYSYKGLPEVLRTAHGPILLRDAGLITFADTFDLATDEFLSSEILVNNGPHPEADSDFTLFCEVVTQALT